MEVSEIHQRIGKIPERKMKELNLEKMANITGGNDGQGTADCIADAYSNHGRTGVALELT